jgi:7-cyano-7-deazaguanine synthase
MKRAVLSLSGGMDSTSLLLHLLSDGYEVTAIGFNYGQKHVFELEQAQKLVEFLQLKNLPVTYDIIELKGLSNLLMSGLVNNNSMELKTGHYAHENALTSVVPNRNAIFSSIAYAVALSIVKRDNVDCLIALATHLGDFDNNTKEGIYPDCSEEFKVAIEYAFKVGNWDSERVNYYAPYNRIDKTGVLRNGIDACNKLELNYEEVYILTNTSYSPIKIHTGEWISDYKTGSSIERVEAFMNLKLHDPILYANEDGSIVDILEVEEYVKNICKEWRSMK